MALLKNYPFQILALAIGIGYILGGWETVAVSCIGYLAGYLSGYILKR